MSKLSKKLGTSKNKDKLRGVFTINDLDDILEDYIIKYMLCDICGNPGDTHWYLKDLLKKDTPDKLLEDRIVDLPWSIHYFEGKDFYTDFCIHL